MLRRRLIRSLAAFPLLLVIAAWIASYSVTGGVRYARSPSPVIEFDWSWGAVWINYEEHPFPSSDLGWHAYWGYYSHGPVLAANWSKAGFDWWHSTKGFGEVYSLGIPFWFLTVLAAFLLYMVWHLTRPQSPTGAFPVQPQSEPV